MLARAVIGANFGDEGKGLVTDYLCRTGGEVVVRFNGGAQAGHTVVTPKGERHVFNHFGSGTLYGVPTFLSQFFICNPVIYFMELKRLEALGVAAQVFAHPDCLVTTFADMIINQRKEEARSKKHGSCGMGVHETIQRSTLPHLKITMGDLWHNSKSLPSKLAEICDKWAMFRTGKTIVEPKMVEMFLKECTEFANQISPAGIGQCNDPIFEGAQGLLLSQDRTEFMPHLTHSYTGMRNIKILCEQAKIDKVTPYYVSRTYFTRHGNGPLPGEDANLNYADDTNQPNPWQGSLRFAPLDTDAYGALRGRCHADFGNDNYKLVLTHCDQIQLDKFADLYSYGPTRADVTHTKDSP